MSTPCRTLIVDDDDDMAFLMATAIDLANDGLTVVGVASSGDEALRQVREAEPDMIVMDYRMPGRDGLEVAGEILAADPGQKIILFSAYLDDATIAAAKELGIQECVSKSRVLALPEIIRKYCPAA